VSERRQLTLLLVGLLVLTTAGVVGATLFPEDCEELERRGELELAFTDATAALPVDDQVGAALEALGPTAGIGPWRGAVTLPDGAVVSRSEFGFFIVTAEDFVVLRPSLGIASAPRSRAGAAAIPTGTSLALRAADGETGVFNGEYELDRCGQLPPNGDVLALDRGFAVVTDGPEVALVTLSGDEVWRAPSVRAAHITGEQVVLAEGALVELRDLQSGEVLDRLDDLPLVTPVPWIAAVDDRLLLPAVGGVVPVTIGSAALDPEVAVSLPGASGPVLDAAGTPGGIVALGAADPGGGTVSPVILTDRSALPAEVPPSVDLLELHASEDGHVGLLVAVDGVRALLVFGPDRAVTG
jgi:hypothetical protein